MIFALKRQLSSQISEEGESSLGWHGTCREVEVNNFPMSLEDAFAWNCRNRAE